MMAACLSGGCRGSKELGIAGRKFGLQRQHDLTHGRVCSARGAQSENVLPLLQIGIDDNFSLARVGQNRAGSLGRRGLKQPQIVAFTCLHALLPYFELRTAFRIKKRPDESNLIAKAIAAISAVALAFLEKGAGPVAHQLMGDCPVDDKPDSEKTVPRLQFNG